MTFRMLEKDRELYPMETSYFSRPEIIVFQSVSKTSADRDFWNEELSDLPRSFIGFVEIFSAKTATSLKSFKLVACPANAVFLNPRQEYET